jgi:hypothetical protein
VPGPATTNLLIGPSSPSIRRLECSPSVSGARGLWCAASPSGCHFPTERFVRRSRSSLLAGITAPSEWVVEALATTFERLPQRRYLTLLLVSGRAEPFTRSFTSEAARGTGRELMKRSDVDWIAAGYDDDEREELVEYMLRTLQSLVIDPPDPSFAGSVLRAYFRRWVAPAVEQPS